MSMSKSNFAPTDEQNLIKDHFQTGEAFKITAVAGSGKTSTLRLLAESTKNKGFYLAFNKAIQTDAAKSFPSNVSAKTAHALAFPTHGSTTIERINNTPRMYGRQVANALNLHQGFGTGDAFLAPSQTASFVMEMVTNFCSSADTDISVKHTPYVEGIGDRNAFGSYLLPYAKRAWADLQGKSGKLRPSHDHYLKAWALTNPVIKADFILFDEAQDASPVMSDVISKQASHAQIIAVGDESQSIYGWRGAVNAMAEFPGEELTLTQSFRFGQVIADEANKWLDILDAKVRVRGFQDIQSSIETVAQPDAVLCRTNAQCIQEALQSHKAGKATAIVGGTKDIEIFTKQALRVMSGQGTDHADLVAFKTWAEVCDYVQTDKAGADLKVKVNLLNQYGAESVLSVCDNVVTEAKAEVVVSTAHKAKGREWNSVRVATDFREPRSVEDGGTGTVGRTDAMLAYVTVTRAKKVLDNAGLAWVDQYVPAKR
jgi:hypothetical protein